jgi:hypothetical protein
MGVNLLRIPRSPCSLLGGLSFIPEDEIKIIFIPWTLSSRLLTLSTSWFGLIALQLLAISKEI